MESLWVVVRDVSTAILLLFIRRWGRFFTCRYLSMLVRCYWCISILIIILTIRCCSLTGPLCGWSVVVLFDRRYPSFRNFDSTISLDVIRMKSYVDSLFNPTRVPVRVTIKRRKKKLNITSFQIGRCPVSLACSETAEVCIRASRIFLSHRSPCFPDGYFAALTWNLIDDTVLFNWFKDVCRSH